MAVRTYNDYLRRLLGNEECILACDTAADYLGLTNGGRRDRVQIYVVRRLDIPGTEQIVIPSLAGVAAEECRGLRCTTVNQTIIDLLERDGDEQVITESLANFYEEHEESFADLIIPDFLTERFEQYKDWAMEYYCE